MIKLHKDSSSGKIFWVLCSKIESWKFNILIKESKNFICHIDIEEGDGFFYAHFFSKDDGEKFVDNVNGFIKEQEADDYLAFIDAQF